jgi:ASC-1-like (ASCH) protein
MKLMPEHYYNIVDGDKKYEIRAFDKKRQELKINTNIVFVNKETEEVITKRITELSYFPDTASLFNSSVSLADMLPGVSSVNDAEQIINSIPNLSAKIDIFGIVRIKLGDVPRVIFRANSH